MEDYINHLCKEIKASTPLSSSPLETVYFGGGVSHHLAVEILHSYARWQPCETTRPIVCLMQAQHEHMLLLCW
jgi:hypothetical protein